jgi:transposase
MLYRSAPIQRDQLNLIPTTLGDLIADDHPLRLFDELLDQLNWRSFETDYKLEKRGQPPISPRILGAVLLFGIHRNVRSSRSLEYQLKNNIEFMWLAHGHQIDHSTLARFRSRNTKAIKELHRELIKFAKRIGVVKLGELYVDGTRIQADANRSRTLTAKKTLKLLEQIDQQVAERLSEMDTADQLDDLFDNQENGEKLPPDLRDLKARQAKLQRILQTCQEADAIRKKQNIDPEKSPFQLPVTDQDSRILPNKDGGYAPNYTPIIGVEGELGLIVSTSVINTPNEQDQLVAMVHDVEQSYDVNLESIYADSAYSIVSNVVELVVNQGKDFLSPDRKGDVTADNPAIREDPSKPVADADVKRLPLNPSTKKFDTDAFFYDAEQDVHFCPDGRRLHRIGTEKVKHRNGNVVQSVSYQCDSCEGCSLISDCRRGTDHKGPRQVRRDEYEDVRRSHRERMSEAETKARYSKRFSIGERPYGSIKRNLGFRRFSVRGQEKVEGEWSLVGTAYNLTRLMSHIGSIGALRQLINNTGN